MKKLDNFDLSMLRRVVHSFFSERENSNYCHGECFKEDETLPAVSTASVKNEMGLPQLPLMQACQAYQQHAMFRKMTAASETKDKHRWHINHRNTQMNFLSLS